MRKDKKTSPQSTKRPHHNDYSSNQLHALVGVLSSVKVGSPDAEINATTISDGKGGRILL